jgi:hypothetical protein
LRGQHGCRRVERRSACATGAKFRSEPASEPPERLDRVRLQAQREFQVGRMAESAAPSVASTRSAAVCAWSNALAIVGHE